MSTIFKILKAKQVVLVVIFSILSFCIFDFVPQAHYSMEDFKTVKKADVHVHINGFNSSLVDQAVEDNFRLLNINVDSPNHPSIDKQREIAIELRRKYPTRVAWISTFSMNGWAQSNWVDQTIMRIKEGEKFGALGVKVWKNIGFSVRDKQGNLVMVDDPGFDPVFKFLAKSDMWMVGHQGDPHDSWLPADSMINDEMRDYFTSNPQYYMYEHPEMPSYEEQMEARNHMLEKNPKLKFMGAHFASLEWNVDRIARFLDAFPNAIVDMAYRIPEIQYQSSSNYQKVRSFFIKYKDRILYATDTVQPSESEEWDEWKSGVHQTWIKDWKYLATGKYQVVPEIGKKVRGLNLPSSVIDKLYYQNAKKNFKTAWQ